MLFTRANIADRWPHDEFAAMKHAWKLRPRFLPSTVALRHPSYNYATSGDASATPASQKCRARACAIVPVGLTS